MIVLTLNNFRDYIESLPDQLPKEVQEVYDGMVYYVTHFGMVYNKTAEESLELLTEWLNTEYELEEQGQTEETFTISDKDTILELDAEASQVSGAYKLTEKEKNIVKQYHLEGDPMRLKEKIEIVSFLHYHFGFPLDNEKIKKEFGTENGEGKNELIRFVKQKLKVTYSDSTIRNLITTVICIDNSMPKEKEEVISN